MPAMTKLASVLGRGAIAVLVVGLCACRGSDASRESASAAPANSSQATPRGKLPVPPPLPGDNDPAPKPPAEVPEALSLGDRLAREAASRPAGAVRSEDLLEAIKAKGITVTRSRQVLGQTLNASYCAMAVLEDGLVASVCEYESPAAATAAMKHSEQRFHKVPNRRLLINGKSLLTIANVRDAVENQANTVAAVFSELKAT